MDWMSILQQFFELCVIPLLSILTFYLINLIRTKTTEITDKTDNEILNKYVQMLSEIIVSCVKATKQTYVDTLKKQGTFTEEAQKIAFQTTYDAVMAILTEEAKEHLTEAFGDLTIYITQRIEEVVGSTK